MIFENTQEPIIDQLTFDLVQKIRSNVRRYPDGWGEVHLLTGLMYCADCGAKMYVHRVNNGKREAHAAYLRRKESGWQKAYEARVKAEKKSKIEAMKEEIRQEDQNNGVYLVVADSPEGQPTIVRKGEVYDGKKAAFPVAI